MSQEITGSNSNFQSNCKSMMNALRRAFSFRDKRPTSSQGSEETSGLVMEMQPVATSNSTNNKPRIDSLPTSDVPSTSASCSQPAKQRSPSVYEDTFVAVAADGTIYVKHYYNFNNRAEYHMETVRHGHIRRNSRIIKAQDVDKIYYNEGSDIKDETVCKNWGICMNNVWWASHLNRLEADNPHTNVVLVCDGMHAGFSVVNIDAFAETLQYVGLPNDAPFQKCIPTPPLNLRSLPFIDEDETEEPKQRRTRRNPSAAQLAQ